jgi:hypothetical protein
VGDNGVDRHGARRLERLRAGDQCATGRDDIVDQQGPSGDLYRVGKPDFDGPIAAASLLRYRMRQSELACEIAHPSPGLRVRTDDDGCGINPGDAQRVRNRRHGRQVFGFDAGKDRPYVGRAMKVSVHRDDAIHNSRDQPADRLLADRFAFVERCVLAHVAEIGRQQDEPPCAGASQRFRGE